MVGLVMLSSDKMHLTVGQGDKECHAVYLSCGNIKKSLRSKVGAHCWMMIAQIPIAKFEPSEHQEILTNRLLHCCLDIVLATLKECSVAAQMMLDPAGRLRNVRTFLAAYIADLPEQQALVCIASNYAPSSMAGPTTLGDSAPQPLREGQDTLVLINEMMETLKETNDQDNLAKLRKLAKERNMNGVNKPFW